MKNTLLLFLILFLFVGCNSKVNQEDIALINGYWEIEKVVLAEGDDKEYRMNETFDYFKITDNKGFRKKVMPQLDGTFIANDASEAITIAFENDKVYLKYTTLYNKWKEELKSLTKEKMVLVNEQKNEYHYKKSGPINFLNDGKETK